jgi:flagellar biosynthesis protein FlhG
MSGMFVKIRDQQQGPFSSNELQKLVINGEFDRKDLVFHEESQEWIEAGKLAELSNLFIPQAEKGQERIVYAIGGGKGGVGKTVLTASLGIGLAALGNRVIVVDADLGGANLHTCIGMLEPMYTFYHFYSLQKERLEDIVLDTPVENLKLISGACGTLGLANPKFSQKLRFINELRTLNADVILVDLGAGSSYNVIDFFLAADQGILVTTPEPMAIQETFNFVKVSILRKFFREFKNNPAVFSLLEREVLTQPGRMNSTVESIIGKIRKIDANAANQMEQFLKEFIPHFILNMVHSPDEIKEGDALRTAAKELLSVDIDYIGFIEHDESVRHSVKELRPFIINNPKSKASRSLAKLITIGLLGRKGWKGFKERRKVIKQMTAEASTYPKTDLKENATICSVQCFYWGDCEYQNGGYPCPIRHLDPIFHR